MGTSLRFDHLIVAVNDLDAAMSDYQLLGFTVFYGGKHASGTTHNALIVLEDGSYVELIAKTGEPVTDASAADFSFFFDHGFGTAGYALCGNNIAQEVDGMRERGVAIGDLQPGMRSRPDGEILRWQSALLAEKRFPLLIEDVTPRVFRVPMDTDKVRHQNGVTGIARVTFIVDDLYTGVVRYKALLGVPSQIDHDAAYFLLANGTMLRLVLPEDPETEQHIADQPTVPYSVMMNTADESNIGELDRSKTHGVRLQLSS